jgi:hypothetical protein
MKNLLVVGVIGLFLGLACAPSINALTINQENKNNIRDTIHILIEISTEPEMINILNKYQRSMFSYILFKELSFEIYHPIAIKQTFQKDNQNFIADMEEIIENNPSIQKNIQELSLKDNVCKILFFLFFIFGYLAVSIEDIPILFPLRLIFLSIAIPSLLIFIIFDCSYGPEPPHKFKYKIEV